MFRAIASRMLVIVLFLSIAAPAAAQVEKTVYKLGLLPSGEKNRELDTDVLNVATQAFVESKRFTMVERRQLNAVFTEKDLQGFLGKGSQKLSQVLGLDLVGLVSYIIEDENMGGIARRVFTIEVRLVEAKTGKIIGTINSDRPDYVVPPSTVRDAGRGLYQSVREAFPPLGYVIKVSGKEVVVDLGAEAGVRKGDELEVVKEGEQIIHPKTGEVLSAELQVVGVLKVVSTSPQMSSCKTRGDGVELGSAVRLKGKNSMFKKGIRILKETWEHVGRVGR